MYFMKPLRISSKSGPETIKDLLIGEARGLVPAPATNETTSWDRKLSMLGDLGSAAFEASEEVEHDCRLAKRTHLHLIKVSLQAFEFPALPSHHPEAVYCTTGTLSWNKGCLA